MTSQTAHKTQIYLPERLFRHLKSRAMKDGVSMAAVIRRLLEESSLKREALSDDPFLQLGKDPTETGIRDGARAHDKHIYGQDR